MSTTPGTTSRPGARGRRGGAILEAALVFPILLSLGFGTVEFGYFFHIKHAFQGAAREGARTAILPSATNGDVSAAVAASLAAAGLDAKPYTIQIRDGADTQSVDVSAVADGASILVRVSGTWSAVGVSPLGLISAAKPVSSAAVMRKESSGS